MILFAGRYATRRDDRIVIAPGTDKRGADLDAPDDLAALAFMLGLDAGGTPDEIAAVEGSLTGADERAAFTLQQSAGVRLAAGLAAAEQAEGKKLTLGSMRRAREAARTWSFGRVEGDAF